MKLAPTPRHAPSVCLALLTLVAAWGVAQQAPFTEEEQVTAVDVLIDRKAVRPDGKVRELPKEIDGAELEVQVDGVSRPIVGFLDPAREDVAHGEPWTLVLYFDLASSATSSARWAAGVLGQLVPELTSLGSVEIVVADPWPRRRLAPTRDSGLLAETLSGLMLDPSGTTEILANRATFLEALPAGSGLSATELVGGLTGEEIRLATRGLDGLQTALAEKGDAASGRVVFWVSDGFDLEPAGFYRRHLGLASDSPADPRLGERTREAAETVAGYGWVVVPVVAPARDPGLVTGLRIGKWRFTSFVPPPGTGVGGTLVREHQREPETAEAFLELGQVRLEAGEAEAAEEAFERALYHFAGDPRTAVKQAVAKVGLGSSLLAQDKREQAREAFEDAVALDGKWADQYPGARAAFAQPVAPLEVLAEETAGAVVRDLETLKEAVDGLGRRLRLTYQIEGVPRGVNLPLEVKLAESDLRLRFPRWTRSGTPDTMAAARARRVLGGDWLEGDFELWVELVSETSPGEPAELVLELDLSSQPLLREDLPRSFRLTVGQGGPEKQTVRHQRLDLDLGPGETTWMYRLPASDLGEDDWVAVVVEDLGSGVWSAGWLEGS